MKKSFLFFLVLFVSPLCSYAQIINSEYFPVENEIDEHYKIDNQKWVSNYEWQLIIGKYTELWKSQMYLEMERLISIIPESETKIRENQRKWEETIESDYNLVSENVNFNLVGRENYIGEFSGGRIDLYREKAKYYLCLYYTIIEQRSEDCLDKQKTILAK